MKPTLLLLSTVLATMASAATPFTSQLIRQTFQKDPITGLSSVIKQETGVYVRDANGNEAQHWYNDKGQPTFSTIRKNGVAYDFAHAQKKMRVETGPLGVAKTGKPDVVAGIACVTNVIKSGGTGALNGGKPVAGFEAGAIVGSTCDSPDYGITLKREMNAPGGFHVVEQVTSFHLGAAPDPKLFDMPVGYAQMGGPNCPPGTCQAPGK